MPAQSLTDEQRGLIHNLALDARTLLTREAGQLLEGVYGLHADGTLEPPDSLPQVRTDPEAAETYRCLAQFLRDETQAGLKPDEVIEKLIKEVAFTHLNRLVAFKMMEARKLIRGTLDKGLDSNAFKFYLADPQQADEYALYQRGETDAAYRRFLLWQSAQVAEEVRVLFDPDNLPSRLFPRPRVLQTLLDMLNQPELHPCWLADETIGWVYQYFNEPELQAAFEKVRTSGAKFEAKDIPSATQLFTPHWIVRFLVQNTLGRLWVRMHPDTQLLDTELLDYLAPLQDDDITEPLRSVSEITLLDPSCGAMHFGLVAYDLFHAMYEEEMQRAGEPGWPDTPSLSDPEQIPAAIIEHNLFGIDIDLRAVQLAALALYLKAKSYNPDIRITESNLAVADVLPLNGARLGAFLREAKFTRPVYERVIRALWERLQDVQQLGSLLRLEQEIGTLIDEERGRYEKMPLFAGIEGEFEAEASTEDFWDYLDAQIVQALDEFARQQAAEGVDMTFFAGEAVKGLRLLELMLRRYDVVVTNPPYLSRRKMNKELSGLLDDHYPEGKGDFYAAFIQRNLEYAEELGYVGMLTMHSFMFISSYEKLRQCIRDEATIDAVAHCGPALFDVGNPGTLQTTAFALRKEPETPKRENNVGTYYRLVHAPNGDAKRAAFEQALRDGSATYHVAQRRFDAIPGSPWVYWVSEEIRDLFEELLKLEDVARPTVGLQTGDNFRFVRYWWEVGETRIIYGSQGPPEALATGGRWFPYMKGGGYCKWLGNQDFVVNWHQDGHEIKNFFTASGNRLASRPQNTDYYFREGVTYSYLTSATFSARYSPGGFIFDVAGSSLFPSDIPLVLSVLNSEFAAYTLKLINPTVNFQVGDLARLPIPGSSGDRLKELVRGVIAASRVASACDEGAFDFIHSSASDRSQSNLTILERQINEEVYRLYNISDEDRTAIEDELAGGALTDDDEDEIFPAEDEDEDAAEAPITREELCVRWLSYAVGVALGRFQPGVNGALGRAVFRREDFAVGSLPEPDNEEFDRLVGPPGRFAYIDTEGGRHVFSAEVEAALQALALPDGIAVLDEGHPRDLPALVWQALVLMLGEDDAREVVNEGAGGDLRKFLERDFFTKWHLKWYRKRPVYWPLQSAKRSYGFVLFHERIDRSTLYVLQRDYLDTKLNGLGLRIQDLEARKAGLSGSALKQVEREIDRTAQVLTEVQEFADTMARIVSEGYEPELNWIDDGVILRMAPLWELIPIWKSEPKKYWERLQNGDYDWSHIAMNYWPERVREQCKTNKSFAIAHGLESLYEGE